MGRRIEARRPAKEPSLEARKLGTGSVAKVLQMFGKNPPPFEIEDTLKAYSKMPWLRAINDKIGSSFAGLRWRAFVAVTPGEKGRRLVRRDIGLQRMSFDERTKELNRMAEAGELVEIPDHPVLAAIYNEGDQFTGVTLRELTQKWLDLVGEAFWVKIRNSEGMPVEFLPVPPNWIKDTPRSNEPWFELDPPDSAGSQYSKRIPIEDMIWFCHPDPFNPYLRGVGMGTTLADELETDEYAAKFLKSFFFNNARPDFLITSPDLSKEDTVRLEQRWIDKLRGVFRGFAPFFVNRKLDVQKLTADYGHLQMLDLRAAQRDTCLHVYGAQPEIFGITESSNRATSEVAEYMFTRWVIVPRAEFMRSVLQVRLVPDYDSAVILHYDSPVMHDKEFRLKVAMAAPWILDVDEWRELGDWKPKAGGLGVGVHCKPLNYEFFDINDPLALPSGGTPPPDDPSAPDDSGEPPEDDEGPDEDQEEALAGEIRSWIEGIGDALWKDWDSIVENAENGEVAQVAAVVLSPIEEHRGVNRRLQKMVVLEGIRCSESVLRWCPKGAKLDPYTPEAFSYAEHGGPILDEFIDDAYEAISSALPALLEALSAKSAVEIIISNLAVRADEWEKVLLSDDLEAAAEAANDGAILRLAKRMAADAYSYARLTVAKDAVSRGFFGSNRVTRVWVAAKGDPNSELNGEVVQGLDFWTLDSGGTVALPTRSHPDCQGYEKLVINGGEA
jgi:phage portal protein BeeE